jgi:NADH oxidase (H2O2-forming)
MKVDVIIIGGGPAGIITALTAKSVYPDKSVHLIKEIGDGVIPCAIPYMIRTMSDPAENKMGDLPLQNAGIDVTVGKVVSFDAGARKVRLESGEELLYGRLVLATGSDPIVPPIPGIHKEGVFSISKSLSAITALREKALKAKSVVILGGGFIGAEFADELSRIDGLEVHLVEILPKLLVAAFDDEFCDEVGAALEKSGVTIHTGKRLDTINGKDHVESVTIGGGKKISADMVIVGIGAKPAGGLAEEAGLRVVDEGSIWVDSYMRTTDEGVFAVGDCAVKRDFFTRKKAPIMLASNATTEARIAGTNLFGIRVLRQIQGTISAFSTKIGGISFASAGMTCRACKKEGFRYISADATAPDRHPGTLAGARQLKIKLIFADKSGNLLGGQISGGDSVGELINVVALGIEKNITVREMDMMQIATHPLLTSAPTVHPLINAAHRALAKLRAGTTN